jgi:protein SCO1/2
MAVLSRRFLIAAGAMAAAVALTGCDKLVPGSSSDGKAFKAIDITGADYAKELSLPDVDGRVRTLADFKGKVIVVFFGYVQCPDVCPTTMAELAAVKRELGPDGERVQGIFVTVDPERDTAEMLKAYVANFDPGFVALRGTPDEIKAAAKHFKIFFSKVPGKTEGSYTVDHTAGSYVFDTQGRVRLFTRYGSGAPALVHDLRLLLAEQK